MRPQDRTSTRATDWGRSPMSTVVLAVRAEESLRSGGFFFAVGLQFWATFYPAH